MFIQKPHILESSFVEINVIGEIISMIGALLNFIEHLATY